jgi:apolipoprotein D and lipocalin family protein
LVGYPGRSYGWILSRSPGMDEATYQALLARFGEQGYDVSRFRRVPQTPEQIGQPGYQ